MDACNRYCARGNDDHGTKPTGSGLGLAGTGCLRPRYRWPPPEVTVESIEIGFSLPHGKRFCKLVHAVFSVVALDSGRRGIEEVARVQGRIFGATDEEVAARQITTAAQKGSAIKAFFYF